MASTDSTMTRTGHLLIVEDDPELAENLVEILDGLGYRAESVPSAEEALERVLAQPFDGVITDFRLPGLNGIELIDRLRKAGAAVPVVVVSAMMDRASAQTAESAGALDVLSKPIDLERLFSLVEAFVDPRHEVLIVDDNEALAENVADALRQEGLEPTVSATAFSALSQRMLPRIALIDLRLPDLDGVELARRLRRRDPRIEILFVTAYAEDLQRRLHAMDRDESNEGGRCVEKPFDMASLVDRVKRATERQ
jgi:CheY-like chemotaxis protein